jgi:hypothetical protein
MGRAWGYSEYDIHTGFGITVQLYRYLISVDSDVSCTNHSTTGKGLSWVSFIPTELPHNPTSATYSIDGGSPVSFNLPGLPANAGTTVYNQFFFSTPDLPPGPHTLLVVHDGTPQQTPLTLSYLIVTNTSSSAATLTPNSSSIPTSTNPLSTPTQSASKSGGPPIGATVGGVVGGVIALVLVLVLLFLYRQRRKRASQGESLLSDPDATVTPFMMSYGPSSGPQALTIPAHSEINHPTSRMIVTNPTHRQGPSAGGLSDLSLSTSNNSRSTGPLNTGAIKKQAGGLANFRPVSHVIHQDSGMRFPPQDDFVDVPPGYSAT